MAVATFTRRSKSGARRPAAPVLLREDFSRQNAAPRVDEELGVIYGLKICGLQSDNGRDYTPEALRDGVPLYEGKPCYSNHRQKGQQRPWQDDIGIWRGVNFQEGRGLFGNLHYDKESDDAKRLVYRCKNLHENVGFSHDADTDPKFIEIREGRPFVTRITAVNSIDLVADPATTSGLTEGTMNTVKSLLESLVPKLSTVRQQWGKRLLEEDGMGGDGAADGDSLGDALKAAVMAILDDGSMDAATKAKNISTWIKTHGKMTQEPEPEAPVAEADDTSADDKKDDDKEKAMESRLAKFERKEEVETLLETLQFAPTKEQKAKLVECNDAGIRKELAEAYKAATVAQPKARSGNSHRLTESRDDRDETKDKRWETSCLLK